jgi:hypothetical protein
MKAITQEKTAPKKIRNAPAKIQKLFPPPNAVEEEEQSVNVDW